MQIIKGTSCSTSKQVSARDRAMDEMIMQDHKFETQFDGLESTGWDVKIELNRKLCLN
jgi:hypothetical protein